MYGSERASEEQKQTALSVGNFRNRLMGGKCTAFLISNNLVVTNEHCVKSFNYELDDLEIYFNYNTENEESINCGEVLYVNEKLDLAILKAQGNPSEKYNSVVFSSSKLEEDEDILVIHYNKDNLQYKGETKLLFSEGKSIKDEKHSSSSLYYKAYTLPGTSGSPVFSKKKNKYYFIGLHNVHYGGKVDYGTVKGGNSASQIYDEILSLPGINADDIKLQGNKYIKTVNNRYKTGEIKEVGKEWTHGKTYIDSDLGYKFGKWNEYYKNGNLKAQKFYNLVNGFKTSRWVYYYENGNERLIINYANHLTEKEIFKTSSEKTAQLLPLHIRNVDALKLTIF